MKKVYYSKLLNTARCVAIIVANDEEEARTLLLAKIKEQNLPETPFSLERVSRAEVGATIIGDE